MKKLRIISYSFPPSNAPSAQRPYSIAKYLSRAGYDVRVVSCSNQDYPLGSSGQKLGDLEFRNHKVIGIPLHWIRKQKRKLIVNTVEKDKESGSFSLNLTNKWLFPDKAVSWFPFAMFWCLSHPGQFYKCNVLTTSPLVTNHLIGLILKLLFKTNWIVDIRDFYYLKNLERMPQHFLMKMHKWLENIILRKADTVIYTAESTLKEYSLAYPRYSQKFKVIYNGFDPDDFKSLDDISAGFSNNLPVVIFYGGTFWRGTRSPVPLISALNNLYMQKLIGLEDIEIEIAGNFEKKHLIDLEKYPVSSRIKFLGILPREEVLKRMNKSHLLWLIVGEQINQICSIPLKIFEYIYASRPIICFAPKESETSNIIEDLDIGWVLSNKPEYFSENEEILKRIFTEKLYLRKIDNIGSSRLNKFNRAFQAMEFGTLLK